MSAVSGTIFLARLVILKCSQGFENGERNGRNLMLKYVKERFLLH